MEDMQLSKEELIEKLSFLIYAAFSYAYHTNSKLKEEVLSNDLTDQDDLIAFVTKNKKLVNDLVVKYYYKDQQLRDYISIIDKKHEISYKNITQKGWIIKKDKGAVINPMKTNLQRVFPEYMPLLQIYQLAIKILE